MLIYFKVKILPILYIQYLLISNSDIKLIQYILCTRIYTYRKPWKTISAEFKDGLYFGRLRF